MTDILLPSQTDVQNASIPLGVTYNFAYELPPHIETVTSGSGSITHGTPSISSHNQYTRLSCDDVGDEAKIYGYGIGGRASSYLMHIGFYGSSGLDFNSYNDLAMVGQIPHRYEDNNVALGFDIANAEFVVGSTREDTGLGTARSDSLWSLLIVADVDQDETFFRLQSDSGSAETTINGTYGFDRSQAIAYLENDNPNLHLASASIASMPYQGVIP